MLPVYSNALYKTVTGNIYGLPSYSFELKDNGIKLLYNKTKKLIQFDLTKATMDVVKCSMYTGNVSGMDAIPLFALKKPDSGISYNYNPDDLRNMTGMWPTYGDSPIKTTNDSENRPLKIYVNKQKGMFIFYFKVYERDTSSLVLKKLHELLLQIL